MFMSSEPVKTAVVAVTDDSCMVMGPGTDSCPTPEAPPPLTESFPPSSGPSEHDTMADMNDMQHISEQITFLID